jgi:prolipoprotein diacylglyceryltransferase
MIDGVKVHPAFLYESIINVIVFIFLVWYRRNRKKNEGEVFAMYLILYSAGRFFVEGLRTDSLMFLNMRVAQLISAASIIVGIALLVYLRKRKENL